jgi:hypothetical protein
MRSAGGDRSSRGSYSSETVAAQTASRSVAYLDRAHVQAVKIEPLPADVQFLMFLLTMPGGTRRPSLSPLRPRQRVDTAGQYHDHGTTIATKARRCGAARHRQNGWPMENVPSAIPEARAAVGTSRAVASSCVATPSPRTWSVLPDRTDQVADVR